VRACESSPASDAVRPDIYIEPGIGRWERLGTSLGRGASAGATLSIIKQSIIFGRLMRDVYRLEMYSET
jgi:hypothetical protein